MKLFRRQILTSFPIVVISTIFIFSLSGCADAIEIQIVENVETVGFWYGLWHGIIAPISFVISLFDNSVAMYAVYNNGAWYNFGFLLGVLISAGGGAKASKKK